jgi:metalloprotein, YbeY/UPF0054 family
LSKLRTFLLEAAWDLPASPVKRIRVVLMHDALGRRLNRRYLGRTYAPDVLSFPLDDEGEVYVNLDKLRRMMGAYGLADLVAYYALHGVLHLLGYTHHGTRDTARMMGLQERLFDQWISRYR